MTAVLAPVLALAPAGAGPAVGGAVPLPPPDDVAAVTAFGRQWFAFPPPADWTGDVGACRAGTSGDALRQATLDAINAARGLVGAAPVNEDAAMTATAQEAALLMSANNALDHQPPPSWRCYSAAGAAGAGRSNLSLGEAGTDAVLGQLVEDGPNNYAVGHRRWLLDPRLQRVGIGVVAGPNVEWSTAIQVVDGLGTGTGPPITTWPPAGSFPAELLLPSLRESGRWSLSKANTDFRSATITAAVDGVPAAVRIEPVEEGFGTDTVVFTIGVPVVGRSTTVRVVAPGIDHTWTTRVLAPQALAPFAAFAAHPAGDGFWRALGDGAVVPGRLARFSGDMSGRRLNAPIVGLAPTPTGAGYWMVGADGGIFAFGDAGFYGSTGAMRLNRPVVGMAATPSGRGYWLFAGDGGIFAFGDAAFRGSTGAMRLNRPVVGMGPAPDGGGYWLVADDGGIFAFGNARFAGSTGAMRLNRPVVGMLPTPTGAGYWLVADDGGVFSFGDAAFYGTTLVGSNVVGIARRSAGRAGYVVVHRTGGYREFGP